MKHPLSLREVGARLEQAAAMLPSAAATPKEEHDRLEQMATAILDSEHADFTQSAFLPLVALLDTSRHSPYTLQTKRTSSVE